MKQIKDKKKITQNIFLYLVLLISISSIILPRYIGDLDEIWNYNFANCISKGLIPYKDFNIVITPFLPILEGIILKILPNELIIIRILAIILSSSILFLIYIVLENLKINKNVSILTTAIIAYLLKNYFCIDYNFFVLFLTLLIIYIEIKNTNKKQQIKYNLLIGILVGLCITTKQTTGILIAISTIAYEIIFLIHNKKMSNDVGLRFHLGPNQPKHTNQHMLNIITKIIGITIPITILLIYLILNHALYDFFDYCILGIKTFNNKVSYINLIKSNQIAIKILSILVPLSWLAITITSLIKKDKKLFIILTLSIAEFVVTFPISDNIHFLIGSIPSLIGITYLLNILKEKINKNIKLFFKFFFEYLAKITVIAILIWGLYKNYNYITNNNTYSTLQHFKNIQISKELQNTIKTVNEYINKNNKKVYILDSDAALYMIPINRYNKNFDMFNKGNLGARGEKGQIEDIQKLDNVEILIRKEGLSLNWQSPIKVRNYITQNLEKIGEIEIFDIYKK